MAARSAPGRSGFWRVESTGSSRSFPGFSEPSLADIPVASDLDDALARAGIDAAIVGGPIDERGEYLRRAAAEGLAIICLHPPGADSEAYYQVALSRAETGAVIVPDLPLRLHPGVDSLRQAMDSGELGAFRGLRFEFPRRTREPTWPASWFREPSTSFARSSAKSRPSRPPAIRPASILISSWSSSSGRPRHVGPSCAPGPPPVSRPDSHSRPPTGR